MSLRVLQIPDAIANWPAWLESELVGIQLYDLVQELELLSRTEPKTSSLDESLGESRQAVLESGLGSLSPSQLRTLLRNPQQLIELQELVFVEGGDYWQSVPRSDSLQTIVNQQWHALASELFESSVSKDQTIEPPPIVVAPERDAPAVGLSSDTNVDVRPHSDSPLLGRRTVVWTALAALAACFLLTIIPLFRSSEGAQFFARASLQRSSLVGKDYLELVADTIRSDWNNQPSEPNGIRDQLIAIRDSCDVLLGSELGQLRPEVATELKTRCKKWQTKFNDALEQLASGADPNSVQAEANQIIRKLLEVLPELDSVV